MTAEAWALIVLLAVFVPVYVGLGVLTFRAQKRADAAELRKYRIINEMLVELELEARRRMREHLTADRRD